MNPIYQLNKAPEQTILFSRKDEDYKNFCTNSEHPFLFNGHIYKTIDHFIQSEQFRDEKIKALVRESKTSDEAIMLGKVKIFDRRSDWKLIRCHAMRHALLAKFSQHPELAIKLVNTGNIILLSNSRDLFWGRGSLNNGKNMLGRMLIDVRVILRKEGYGDGTKEKVPYYGDAYNVPKKCDSDRKTW